MDSRIITQDNKMEIHARVGEINEMTQHKYPFVEFDTFSSEDGLLAIRELSKKYPEHDFSVDVHGHGVELDITYIGRDFPPTIVTRGDGLAGELLTFNDLDWVWKISDLKTDHEINLKILLLFAPPVPTWTEVDVRDHLLRILRNGPSIEDYGMIHKRVIEMRADGERVSPYKYWEYVDGAIPGLNYECDGSELMETFNTALDSATDGKYRFLLNGIYVSCNNEYPEGFKPFLVKV